MHFKKLRVHGFKSFVDPTELFIEPGITGVVGPNGCGKSNVIESLRWVMGEASAKRMRGGEMDDVIFGGASSRPARNSAEVTITLDNTPRKAPASFNDAEELEITRRIDRGQGSTYSINGKEVRARDVHLLFADLATGANSTAIVSQGRVGALIGAKPTDRRTLLEEAAGIRGLHSRRHEAELRLNAAESNLERLGDVIGALESRFSGLRRQARQARRYREIAGRLRIQEGILLYLRWSGARETLNAAEAALAEAAAEVAGRTRAAARGATLQARAHKILPALCGAEAEAAARLQSQAVADSQLEGEAERVAGQLEALRARLDQIATDIAREAQLVRDAADALERLGEEKTRISRQQAAEKGATETLRRECDDADRQVAAQEDALESLNERLAAVEVQRGTLNRQIDEEKARLRTLDARAAANAEETEALNAKIAEAGDVDGPRRALAGADAALTASRDAAETAEASRGVADAKAAAARAALSEAEYAVRRELDAARAAAREVVSTAEQEAREGVAEAERTARERIETAERAHAARLAEAKALRALLAEDADQGRPVLEDIRIPPGYETALGAALGDDLSAALDESAARHWTDLGALAAAPPLPPGVAPLAGHVTAPAALSRRLSQIGVVADAQEARRLQGDLITGQRLVSRDGGLWRWDGLCIRPGTVTAAARRLEQRNRLAGIEAALVETGRDLSAARAASKTAVTAARAAAAARLAQATEDAATPVADAERAAQIRIVALRGEMESANAALRAAAAAAAQTRRTQQEAYDEAGRARTALATLERKIAAGRGRLAALSDDGIRIAEDRAEAEDRATRAEGALKVVEDPDALRARIARIRAVLADLRARQVETRSAFDRLTREANARGERLVSIEAEIRSWTSRHDGAIRRQRELEDRRLRAGRDLTALEARPAEIAARRETLRAGIKDLEAERKQAAGRLAEAERAQRDADQALKAAEVALADAREMRIRREAAVAQAMQTTATLSERIREKLECAPEEALVRVGLEAGADFPPRDDIERRIERLERERDAIGPVNLRAEQEARELEQQIASMQAERDDLIAAINRLRQAIGALNREGRERLLRAFEEVGVHFRELFVKLFGGGEAHLKLTESDDPLLAGLEIMASPPGKKMQVLSLLSGGEQALTALALLFGVFLTNPAPICVLDEVDAPLDDNNVDRFCRMLDQIAKTGTTRFLVVTHHRMTMARVDRLFGVTMAERGVSQIVSVDLRQAERLREAG